MDPILHREAGKYGLTPGLLRSARFVHPVDGVAIGTEDESTLDVRTRATLAVLPAGSMVTHLTSGLLRGWWLPTLQPTPVVIGTSGSAVHLQRRGVYVRRCEVPARHRGLLGDLPAVSAEWTIAELAESLSFIDLVIAIDSATHAGHTTLERLRDVVVPGRRGVRTLRKALIFADERSESPGETLLRLAHTVSGIPVDVQPEYRDDRGVPLLRLDLRVSGTRRAPEYDGAAHRTAQTQRRDLRRERSLHQYDIKRAGYTLPEIRFNAEEIVRDSAEALGSRWAYSARDFNRLFAESSYTEGGQRKLHQRIERFDVPSSPRRKPDAH